MEGPQLAVLGQAVCQRLIQWALRNSRIREASTRKHATKLGHVLSRVPGACSR